MLYFCFFCDLSGHILKDVNHLEKISHNPFIWFLSNKKHKAIYLLFAPNTQLIQPQCNIPKFYHSEG